MVTLKQLRKKIDLIDASIIKKLAERDNLVKQIGRLKLEEGTNIIDLSREKELFEFYENLCDKYKLPKIFIKCLFKSIINHSRKVQF